MSASGMGSVPGILQATSSLCSSSSQFYYSNGKLFSYDVWFNHHYLQGFCYLHNEVVECGCRPSVWKLHEPHDMADSEQVSQLELF
mmetsp:Transcript_5965/g.10293  ORF Transcript_5965/g.10293 Transcript_5965/m.10293 type:complete len:86 (-) Transcript_5965:586-843(-)